MELKVNGAVRQLDDGKTVIDLLALLNVGKETRGVAVAVNESVVPRAQWNATKLHPGDNVEVIHAVQGG